MGWHNFGQMDLSRDRRMTKLPPSTHNSSNYINGPQAQTIRTTQEEASRLASLEPKQRSQEAKLTLSTHNSSTTTMVRKLRRQARRPDCGCADESVASLNFRQVSVALVKCSRGMWKFVCDFVAQLDAMHHKMERIDPSPSVKTFGNCRNNSTFFDAYSQGRMGPHFYQRDSGGLALVSNTTQEETSWAGIIILGKWTKAEIAGW